jgi:hypothetical protein
MTEYKLPLYPPKYAGGYQIGGPFGLRIMIEKKPNWFHRKMMWYCLGWEWVEPK